MNPPTSVSPDYDLGYSAGWRDCALYNALEQIRHLPLRVFLEEFQTDEGPRYEIRVNCPKSVSEAS